MSGLAKGISKVTGAPPFAFDGSIPPPSKPVNVAPDSGLSEAEKSASFKRARRGRSGSLLSGSVLSDKPETLGSPERIM